MTRTPASPRRKLRFNTRLLPITVTIGLFVTMFGSVIALTTMVSAALVEHHGWGPAGTVPLVLAMGAAFGLLHGVIIQYFNVQPFIVTLAGQFLARGLCYLISIDSIAIQSESYKTIALRRIPLGGGNAITVNVIILLVMLAVGIYLAHYTRFGRTVYAIGGNEQSALLMGLPVARERPTVQ